MWVTSDLKPKPVAFDVFPMSEDPIDQKKGKWKRDENSPSPEACPGLLAGSGSPRPQATRPKYGFKVILPKPGTAMKVCDTENVPVDLNARPRDKAVVKCQGRSMQTDIALKKDLACSELHMRRPNAFLSAFKTHLAPSLLTDKTLASKSPNLTRFDPSPAHSTIVTVTSTHVSGRSSITLDSSRSDRLERTSLESDKLHCTSLEAVLASGCVVDDDGGVTGENLSDGMNGSDSEDDEHGFGRLVYLDDSHAIIEEDLRRVDDGKLKPIPPARPSTPASHQGSNSNPMSLRNTAATESKARDAHRLSDDTDAAVKNVGLESSKPRWTIPTQATPTPRGTREGRKGDVVGKAKGIYSGHETDRREQINYAKSTDILSHMSHGKEVKRHIKISERPVMLADDVASGEVPLDEVLEAVIDCVIEGDNLAAEMTLRALSNPFLEPDDMHSDNQVSEKKLPEANAEVDVEWVKYIDESTNMAYFHNIYTGESTWNTPEQYITHDSALPYTPAGSFSKTPPNRGRREDSDRMDNLSPPRSPRPHATPLSTPIRAKVVKRWEKKKRVRVRV
ncbi:hypothetical protein AAMO2058_000211100 [Amorphochlora amoebiformis]